MENIFFDDWHSLIRTVVITILAYIGMVFFLRISGKRTLTKMNAFDFIITVALGSTLAAVCLNKNIALVDGMTCFFLLIFLQFILTWLSVRSKTVKNLITSSPSMLVYKGETLEEVMKKERITIEEIKMAARNQGIEDISKVGIMILETTGEISIIQTIEGDKLNAFDPLKKIKI
ncbi:DUF421 domain-containing protein [Lunatibacter salilacus]|uniref:DUF421 domain-containing protein n=1 Tax=Lunatibacter salilacus TaxID=2483804 RepID=UPI00131BD5E0|nr:YetF domain-containing protein [Lunatibacter salilacus]